MTKSCRGMEASPGVRGNAYRPWGGNGGSKFFILGVGGVSRTKKRR